MKRFLAALLALPLLATPALSSAASAQTSAAPPPVHLTVGPVSITRGQNTLAQVNARAGETVALYVRPDARTPWRLIRSKPTVNGYAGWVVTPGSTMDFLARPVGAPQSRNSAVVTVRVAAPAVPACSATSLRTSHLDSANCLMKAYKRGDWAAVSNYALPPVVSELRQWRAYDVATGFPYSFHGCGGPETALGWASSGVTCAFYSHPTPGDGMIHGVAVDFNMDVHFRAESIETAG